MLIAVCSLKGSPGATTLATALGACWPPQQSLIVVEADPAGGDLMARFRLPDTPGLVSWAAAARGRGGADPSLLVQHAQSLLGGLRVVSGPVGAEQARAALAVLASGVSSPLRRAADQPDTVVIADCGRVDPGSPALPIVRGADAMLLLSRPRDDELAHVALKLQAAQQWSRRPCLVLVGDGYPTAEVSQTLQIPVMGRVPADTKGAAMFSGQGTGWRGADKSALGRAAAAIAVNLHAHGRQPTTTDGSRPLHLRLAVVGDSVPGVPPQRVGPHIRNGATP
ncbi:chromosome partitioning protein [Amycolatopsis eburnea]|uniref:Chromosome partitioning protein n=1 Tax=Amycolatopsis eburnea TaxID=2267691 RepID=A0A3R9EP13_9PSEU|nr:chromosome partitioning protein [Amycolatopsis eburnea]RSD13632.1 chromosome partitioning protein [Amycolatopsis eburnea]